MPLGLTVGAKFVGSLRLNGGWEQRPTGQALDHSTDSRGNPLPSQGRRQVPHAVLYKFRKRAHITGRVRSTRAA